MTMTTEIFKLPTKVIDGVVTTVDIATWANITLDSANLALFNSAKSQEDTALVSAMSSGIVSITSIDNDGNLWHPTGSAPPHTLTVINDNGNMFVKEVYADGTANVAYPPYITPCSVTVINNTTGTVAKVDFNGYPISSNVSSPAGIKISYDSSQYQVNVDYAKFKDQYMADPTLTWPA